MNRGRRSRRRLSRAELEPLVDDGRTIAEIARILDRSPSSVRYWLRAHGLRTRNRRGPRPAVSREAVDAAVSRGERELIASCPRHGDGVFVIENSGRVRCRRCRMERVSARRRKVKEILVREAGGKCVLCGYSRFMGALHFHHLDPSAKEFGLSQKGATVGIDRLRAEAAKCVLLCGNCHIEVEAGVASLPA